MLSRPSGNDVITIARVDRIVSIKGLDGVVAIQGKYFIPACRTNNASSYMHWVACSDN